MARSRRSSGRPRPPTVARAHGDVIDLGAHLQAAMARRQPLLEAAADAAPTTAFRLVHGEADGIPGAAVDVYDRHLVLHAYDLTDRAERALTDALRELPYAGLYLKRHPRQKNEVVAARDTAMAPAAPVWGEAAPDTLVILEHGVPYGVRLGDGFRTGIFLDQRDNRNRIGAISAGKRVLNLFAYTGAFSVAALHGGAAHARCVDVSAAALRRADENVARIDGGARYRAWTADAFFALERLAKGGDLFDIVIVDPPSYATSGKRRFRVTRDYPDLVARAAATLRPGGRLLACINHHGVTQRQLREFVRAGLQRAGRAPLLDWIDHPTQADFPAVTGGEPLAKSALATLA